MKYKKILQRSFGIMLLFAIQSASCNSAQAAPITWTNTSGGLWSVAANWSPNAVPAASSDVFITNSGTYTVTMDVSPVISSLTIGGPAGQQTVTNSGKTVTLSLASAVNTNGILGLFNGSLAGSGSLIINGLVQWNGGGSGNGFAVTVQSNATLNLQAGMFFSGPLTNSGTINWLGGILTFFNNGTTATGELWNQAGAVFDIQSSTTIGINSAPTVFHNAGLMRKETVGGTTSFGLFLDNTGTVQDKLGIINFSAGSNLGGIVQADGGAAINFTAGTFTLSAPPDFQGPGTVQMTGGNLTLNAFTGAFTLNGVTLAGQSTIAATGVINLNGSNLGNAASLTIASNAVLNLQSAAQVIFAGAVTNSGTINWLAGGVFINNNGSTTTGAIWNQPGALWDIQCSQSMNLNATQGTFHNAGTVRKEVVGGTTTIVVFFDNSGAVQAKTGTVTFSGGSNLGGMFQADNGAAINFTTGTFMLSAPPNFQGPGTVQLTGGSLTLNAFTGAFTLNGVTLVGQNTIAATGSINLNGSNLGQGASLSLASNAVLNLQSSAQVIFAGAVTNSGTINWLAGSLFLQNNGSTATGEFWNQAGGLFDIQCNQSASLNSSFGSFHNAGTVRKETAAGTTAFSIFFDNTGMVQVKLGTINFANGSNLGGVFQADNGATINFTAGTYTLSNSPNFQGPGAVQLTGGNLTLNAFTGTNTLSGVTLVGQNTIAANGIINLNGSHLGNGATLSIASNAVLNLQAAQVIFSGAVTNFGMVNWLAGSLFIQNNGSTATGMFWNQSGAVFDIQCNQVASLNASQGTFHNAGLVRKEIVAGTTGFSVPLDNSGLVQAKLGTISVSNGGNLGGVFQADSGAAINFTAGTYTLSSPPNFQGPGTVQFTGGSLTLSAFTGTFTLNGIALVGQNTIATNGIINLNGSSLGQGASLAIASNAVLNLQGFQVIFAGPVTNAGTVNWSAGSIYIQNNGSTTTGEFWNQAGALFEIQCNQSINFNATLGNFHNAGLIRKEVVAFTSTFSVFLDNTGIVQSKLGTINVSGGCNLGGIFQADSGAAINFNIGTYILSNPPTFQGPGQVQITTCTLSAFTGTFTLSGSTLVGQNTVAASGSITLNASTLGSGASLTISSNAVLNLPTAITFFGVVTNQGTINWLAGNLTLHTNGVGATGAIQNQPGALFDIQCDQALNNGSSPAVFSNAGLLRKSAGTNTTAISVKLDNTGIVQAQTGVIGIQGLYSESPAATLAISLSALAPGSGFGKIQFGSKPTFAGRFSLDTLSGYRPSPGNSFLVVSYPSAAGDFTSFNGLDLGSGLRLAPRSSSSGLILVAGSYTNGILPNLTLDHSVNGVLVAWPTNFTGWQLQSTTNLASPAWVTVAANGANNTVVPTGPQGYFRLFQ